MSSEPSDPTVPPPASPDLPPPLAAMPERSPHVFWPRVMAFVLDGLLLGFIGILAGLVMFDWFASLGSEARLIGFGVALIYFGIFNSALCDGQTLGKRIMKIEVVDRCGRHVTLARSCVRYLILGTPFFLNGAITNPSWGGYLAGVVIFGGGGAIIYLFLFNRRTRQSLHDLICGTFVVKKAETGEVHAPTIWRPHLVIVTVGVVIMLVTLAVGVPRLMGAWKFPALLALRERILMTNRFSDVGVFEGKNWSVMNGVRRDTAYLSLTVRSRERPVEYESIARQVAAVALATYPESKQEDVLAVTVVYGFDIGIANSWINRNVQFSPAQWEQKIAEAK